MLDIWYLTNKNISQLMLFQSDEDNYSIVKDGDLQPIISCGKLFTLVNTELFGFLKKYFTNIDFGKEISIHDKQKKETAKGFFKLNIPDEISPQTISSMNSDGIKIWNFEGNIFISGDLKKELELAGFDNLETSLGFWGWG
ncbi:MAG: hypothetical protein IAF38_21230 [Bacteroidia bacterium]|nr:hypothetical protein [Bacteroidia bacterium]